MEQEYLLLNQPWLPSFSGFSCPQRARSPGRRLPPGKEKQRKLSPSHLRDRSCCQQPMGMQGGRRNTPPLHPVAVTPRHQPLSPTPLAAPRTSPGTLLPPGQESMKECEQYNTEYLRTNESKQQNTGGISPLSGKIQPLPGE